MGLFGKVCGSNLSYSRNFFLIKITHSYKFFDFSTAIFQNIGLYQLRMLLVMSVSFFDDQTLMIAIRSQIWWEESMVMIQLGMLDYDTLLYP